MIAREQISFTKMETLSDKELTEKLLLFPGAGLKVVNCIYLFAYHRPAAAHVDAVSYTHLDVYKRQRLRTALGQCFGASHLSCASVTGIQSQAAVDVYKRQEYRRMLSPVRPSPV